MERHLRPRKGKKLTHDHKPVTPKWGPESALLLNGREVSPVCPLSFLQGESAGSPVCLFPATHTLSSQPDTRALGACGADAWPRPLPLRAPSYLLPGSKVALRAGQAPCPEMGYSVGKPRDP